jgi:uncharacterized protein (DUF1800 family)
MRNCAAKPLAAVLAVMLSLTAMAPLSTEAADKSDKKDSKAKAKALAEDRKVLHLLNRIGYGPRAGDLERVKQMGLEKYLELQLHPERITDPGMDTRLAAFPSLRMSISEIQEKYPQPNLLARQLGLRQGKNGDKASGPTLPQIENPDAMTEDQRREYRQQVLAYYRANDLKPPQVLLQELQGQKIIRAVYSDRQLQEVMTDFWFNHFNIYWAKNLDRDLTTDYEMNVIRPNTMGKFKDLLMATAKSPAMLVYLDNFQSSSPAARTPNMRPNQRQRRPVGFARNPGAFGGGNPGTRINRDRVTYGDQADREMQRRNAENRQQMEAQQRPLPPNNAFRNRKPGINENYAREIMELHTLGVEGGYTQKDVQEVARCLTGWTVDRPRQGARFVFRVWMHDDGEKIVLGRKIASGGGIKDGETVIDILVHHPSTAKFISTKLVRRFVSDDPPRALVDRVASVYKKTDGDIREMLRTIFTSSEFYSKEAYRAKIKSPFELAVSAMRALGAEVRQPVQTAQFIAKMGQPLYLYQAPTGYPDKAEQWVNTGALLERLNYGLALSTNKLRGASFDVKRTIEGISAADREAVMQRAVSMLLNGDVSAETRTVLEKQMTDGVPVSGELGVAPRIPSAGGDELMADNSMEALPAGATGRTQKGTGNPERLERRFGQRSMPAQVAMSSAETETAKVFGLVLGSPEFQRR